MPRAFASGAVHQGRQGEAHVLVNKWFEVGKKVDLKE